MYLLKTEPPLDPPEPDVAFPCDVCGEDIYVGETYLDTELGKVCEFCVSDHWQVAEEPEEDLD